MKKDTVTPASNWVETHTQLPEVGKKVVVFCWRDNAVFQAWWNGEHYLLVAADDQGQVQVYQVLPTAISHW